MKHVWRVTSSSYETHVAGNERLSERLRASRDTVQPWCALQLRMDVLAAAEHAAEACEAAVTERTASQLRTVACMQHYAAPSLISCAVELSHATLVSASLRQRALLDGAAALCSSE